VHLSSKRRHLVAQHGDLDGEAVSLRPMSWMS
jgi:hypothetical protein